MIIADGKCPICKVFGVILDWDYDHITGEVFDTLSPQPMYQYSYPGQKLYITPRCDGCMQRALKKREDKKK